MTVTTTAARTMTPSDIPMMALSERGAEGGAEKINSNHKQQPLKDRVGGQIYVYYSILIDAQFISFLC